LGPLDNTSDLKVIDAVGGAASVDKMIKRGQPGIVQLGAAWKTDFIEHGWARFLYVRQAVPPGELKAG